MFYLSVYVLYIKNYEHTVHGSVCRARVPATSDSNNQSALLCFSGSKDHLFISRNGFSILIWSWLPHLPALSGSNRTWGAWCFLSLKDQFFISQVSLAQSISWISFCLCFLYQNIEDSQPMVLFAVPACLPYQVQRENKRDRCFSSLAAPACHIRFKMKRNWAPCFPNSKYRYFILQVSLARSFTWYSIFCLSVCHFYIKTAKLISPWFCSLHLPAFLLHRVQIRREQLHVSQVSLSFIYQNCLNVAEWFCLLHLPTCLLHQDQNASEKRDVSRVQKATKKNDVSLRWKLKISNSCCSVCSLSIKTAFLTVCGSLLHTCLSYQVQNSTPRTWMFLGSLCSLYIINLDPTLYGSVCCTFYLPATSNIKREWERLMFLEFKNPPKRIMFLWLKTHAR